MSPAPDRAQLVVEVCQASPEVFQGPVEESDTRRRAFLPTIVRHLNQVDGENAWGELVKTDQGNKIPADIVVFGRTMEHFDCMTDTGAAWIPKGVVSNPAWKFLAVPPAAEPAPTPLPLPDPEPAPLPPSNDTEVELLRTIVQQLVAQDERMGALGVQLDAIQAELGTMKDQQASTHSTIGATAGSMNTAAGDIAKAADGLAPLIRLLGALKH